VPPEDREHQDREVQSVAVDVLDHPREARLAAVLRTRVRHGARRRGPEERAVVRAAVVVAGDAERERRTDDEERRRQRVPVADDRERRMDAPRGEAGRVERREVRVGEVVRVLDAHDERVHDESTQDEDDRERFDPPPIVTLVRTLPDAGRRRRHWSSTVRTRLVAGKDIEALVTIAVGYGHGAPPAALLRGGRRAAALHEGGARALGRPALGLQADPSPGRRARCAALPPYAWERRAHSRGRSPPPPRASGPHGCRRGRKRGPGPHRNATRTPLAWRDAEPVDDARTTGAGALPPELSGDRARSARGRLARSRRRARARHARRRARDPPDARRHPRDDRAAARGAGPGGAEVTCLREAPERGDRGAPRCAACDVPRRLRPARDDGRSLPPRRVRADVRSGGRRDGRGASPHGSGRWRRCRPEPRRRTWWTAASGADREARAHAHDRIRAST